MKTKKAFDTLLAMYRNKKKRNFSEAEIDAIVLAINTLGAALDIKDWDWGH